MTTRNRGKEASDDRLFGSSLMLEKLKEAVEDMCYLLSRGFAEKSSIQLVGNRYRLNARQQKALRGISASKQQISLRKERALLPEELKGMTVAIDGFNLLITLESALSEAYIFKGLDGYYRDISGVHGTYKRVQKTQQVLQMVADALQELGVLSVYWYFDAPVSNSGRLKTHLREMAEQQDLPWHIDLVNDPDKVLADSLEVVVSSDAWILDRAESNFNLVEYLLENKIAKKCIVEVS